MNPLLRGASILILLVGLATMAPADDVPVIVDPAVQYQTFEGWGVSLCWWANVIGGYPDVYRNDYIEKVFDPAKGLGFNIVRYNIGGGENPKFHTLPFRTQVPGFEPQKGIWDWSADANQRWVLQQAMARGVTIEEAFSNSPPYWMTSSGSVTGGKYGTENLRGDSYEDFADYLTEVVKHYHDNWGITFRTLEPLNEPAGRWWTLGHNQEGCHFDHASQSRIIQAVGKALAAKGLAGTRVSAPDENTVDNTLSSFQSYDATTRQYLAQINTHSYGGEKREELSALATTAGKRLWQSEYGDNDASGLTMSKRIVTDMKELRPAAWVYWQALDQGGWGMLVNGVTASSYAYKLQEKYFVMANYSRFIRPGATFIGIDDKNSVASYQKETRTLVIVSTNDGAKKTSTYDISKFSHRTGGIAVYRTSAGENLVPVQAPIPSAGKFTYALPAQSVTTFVFTDIAP